MRGPIAKIGCALVPLLIVVAVIGVIASALRSCDVSSTSSVFGTDPSDNRITLSGSTSVLGGDGGELDVVVSTQTVDGSDLQRQLTRLRVGPTGISEVWDSAELSESLSRAEVALAGDTLFVAYDDQLLALDEVTGDTRWQTTLRDRITNGCADCFSVVGDVLVVRTTDAHVTAYATSTAEPRWSRRLRSPSGSIATPGDWLLVVDDPEDTSATTPVETVDPATGEVQARLAPTCPRGTDGSWDVELSPGDPVWPVAGSDDVVAAFGFGDGCVVRWSPADGSVRWTSRLNGAGSIDDEGVVLGAEDLALGLGSALVSVDLATGAAQLLPVPNESQGEPGVIVGRTLVANTATTRGTPRWGLAGYDLRSGERRWAQQDLGAAQPASQTPYFSSDALFSGSPRSLLVPEGADGLRVLVFEGDDGTYTSQAVDLATGDLAAGVRRAYARDQGGTPSLTVESIEGDRVLITIDSLLQSLPASGRGEVFVYPDD